MTADEVRALLRQDIEKAGTAKAWAERHGVSITLVSDTVNGRREPARAIMKGLGLERQTIFYRVGE